MGARRVALRIAYRDALAHKVRSLLVILLVGLPVLVVTVGLVIGRTAHLSDVERLDRELGNASALVVPGTEGPIYQRPGLERYGYARAMVDGSEEGVSIVPAPTRADLRKVLGEDARVVEMYIGSAGLRANDEAHYPEIMEFDLDDEIVAPLYEFVSGDLPEGTDEVLVNQRFLDDTGRRVGDRLGLHGQEFGDPTIVGVAESPSSLAPWILGRPGAVLPESSSSQWLVDSRPVVWADVKELNELGFTVGSRQVVLDPPAEAELYAELDESWYSNGYDELAVVVALIVVMVVLEVALLAGPALAVTARQQSRTLALVAAAGGTPSQARSVVIAQGVVLGAGAAVGGAVLGVLLAVPAVPIAQAIDGWTRFGPFDVPWAWLLAVVAVGVLAVLLAAVIPAWATARQDPVRALAGRRADGSTGRANPWLGAVLLFIGAGLTWYGTQKEYSSEIPIAFGAVVVVLGVLCLIPMLLVWVSRLSSSLPFALRYAGRDAARHRGRTAPAVAAVMATVAGVVAVGITVASQSARDEARYQPSLPSGQTKVSWWAEDMMENKSDVAQAYREVLEAAGLEFSELVQLGSQGYGNAYVEWSLRNAAGESSFEGPYLPHGDVLAAPVVADSVDGLLVPDELRTEADAHLSEGRTVAFVSDPDVMASWVGEEMALNADRLVGVRWDCRNYVGECLEEVVAEVEVDVAYVEVPHGEPINVSSVVPASEVDAGEVSGFLIDDALTKAETQRLEESLEGVAVGYEPYVFTERGYESEDVALLQLILVAGGAALMLVGTLTATFLALSDARPDLATMGAVGAAPRTRRGVGAAYAGLVSFVGAALGVLVGFVPGFAASWAMTIDRYEGMPYSHLWEGPYFSVPWWLLGVVLVGLPLFCAAVMWLSAKSRLPLVARID